MIDINELRQLAQAATPGPDGISLSWITLLQDFQQGVSPAVINELLDRLEAAESDALEQARLNGMGASREAALMAKLEAAERERDALRIELNEIRYGVAVTHDTIKALRAKIEAMEQQEPVAIVLNAPKLKRHAFLLDAGKRLPHKANLYAGPSAQPAPSIPEGWKLIPIEPTEAMLVAGDLSGGTYYDVAEAIYRAMLAAAPEAKP